MIFFLKRLLDEYDFKTYKIESKTQAAFFAISNSKSSNIIVTQANYDQINRCEETCDEIFNHLKTAEGWESSCLKNTYLTFVLDMSDLNTSILVNLNQKTEENKYLFKKHVLSYYPSELKGLLKELKDADSNSFKDYISKTILTPKAFHEYKNNPNIPSSFALLMRMMVKLPFTEVNPEQLQFSSISETINEEIKKKQLDTILNFALKDHTDNELMLKELSGIVTK